MWVIIGQFLAGIGISFIGTKLLKTNLQIVSSVLTRKLQKKIHYYTSTIFLRIVFGIFLNFFSGGESSIVAYSFAGLVAAQLLEFNAAASMLTFGSIGTSLIYYLAAIDMKVFVLYLVGSTGIIYFFDKNRTRQAIIGGLCGLFLILYGITFIKTSSLAWLGNEYIRDAIIYSAKSWILILLFGVFIRLVFQLFWITIIISIAMLQSGYFDLTDIIIIHVGSRIATGIASWMLCTHYDSPAKQVLIFQVICSLVPALLGSLSVVLEYFFHIPLLTELLLWTSDKPQLQVVNLSLVLNFATALLVQPNLNLVSYYIGKIYPFKPAEDAPKYVMLAPEVENPTVALDLLENEQNALLENVASLCNILNWKDDPEVKKSSIEKAHKSFQSLIQKIKNYTDRIPTDCELSVMDFKRYTYLMNCELYIEHLEEAVYAWATNINELFNYEEWQKELYLKIEAMDAILLEAYHSISAKDMVSIEHLKSMSSDKRDVMESIREEWSVRIQSKDKKTYDIFFDATQSYEVSIWLIQNLATLVYLNKNNLKAV